MAGMMCQHSATPSPISLRQGQGTGKPETGLGGCAMGQKECELWHQSGQASALAAPA